MSSSIEAAELAQTEEGDEEEQVVVVVVVVVVVKEEEEPLPSAHIDNEAN